MQILAYLYPNTVTVQLWDQSIFTPRNRVVYSRPIKIYQGIANTLQVVVLNQDQKSVDLTGYSIEAEIQDPVNEITAYSYAVTFTDQAKGRGTFTVPLADVNSLDQRLYKLTLKTVDQLSGVERVVYIDANWTAPLDLEVLPAYYADTAPAPALNEVVIDSGLLP
jgi:hypothetical protein